MKGYILSKNIMHVILEILSISIGESQLYMGRVGGSITNGWNIFGRGIVVSFENVLKQMLDADRKVLATQDLASLIHDKENLDYSKNFNHDVK